MYSIRKASLDDAPRLVEIYDYYVKNSAITFEYVTPTVDEFKERMKNTMKIYPYLVAVEVNDDDGGEVNVVGYAYADHMNVREAYDWSAEMTIYLDHDVRGKGLGRKLYDTLENMLKQMGICNLYACIGLPVQNDDQHLTHNSAQFHSHLGFKVNGRFHKCGYKFNTWYDMIWMEKIVGTHTDHPQKIEPCQWEQLEQ